MFNFVFGESALGSVESVAVWDGESVRNSAGFLPVKKAISALAALLMYGPFQAVMPYESGLGVATWLRGCLQQHGLPSLVRFDQRQRAQVFRRDQFQPWFDALADRQAS